MARVPGVSQHHQLVGGWVAGLAFVGEWKKGYVEVSGLIGGCLILRAGKPQVVENPCISVIEDSSFCQTTRRCGPRSWAGVFWLISYFRNSSEMERSCVECLWSDAKNVIALFLYRRCGLRLDFLF